MVVYATTFLQTISRVGNIFRTVYSEPCTEEKQGAAMQNLHKNLIHIVRGALFATAFMSPFSLFADAAEAEALERQMWEDMKHRNYKDVESNLAAGFQSVHSDGARARAEEMQLIKSLYLGTYTISDMMVSEAKDCYIITYKISVSETIDEKRLQEKTTPRMSVWQKIDGKWQWVAHANLNPISAGTKTLPKAPNPNT